MLYTINMYFSNTFFDVYNYLSNSQTAVGRVGRVLAHGRTVENVLLPQGQDGSGHFCMGGTDCMLSHVSHNYWTHHESRKGS